MAHKFLDVVVVGGSLTGLFHGVALKRLGHNVRILERSSPDDLRQQGAGIAAREEVQNFLDKYDDFSDQPYYVPGDSKIQFINHYGEITKTWNMQLSMTSWDTLYHRLRANFDGLQSDYVAGKPRPTKIGVGGASYEFGCDTTNVKYDNGVVEVEFERSAGGKETLRADTERRYVGYVAWRGTVIESQISDETKALFGRSFNYFIYSKGHIVVYLIPGKNGSLKPGERHLNYVWYCNYAANSPELRDLMTDTEGHHHHVTTPLGKIRPEVCDRQKAHADKVLPAAFAEVVRSTKQPFVQCITDVSAPRAVFFHGHLILAGDALCTFRPHLGASTNQAALQALLLCRTHPCNSIPSEPMKTTFQGTREKDQLTIQAYESQVLQYARITSLTSIAWGNKNQFSVWTFLGSVFWLALAYLEFWAEVLWNRFLGRY